MAGIVCGPSGGSGGQYFCDEVGSGTTVGEVRIRARDVIDSVQFVHVGARDAVFEQPAHGGLGGTASRIILGETASIVGISGRYGDFVDFVTLHVKREEEGGKVENWQFGGAGGPATFEYSAPPGYEIVGFCGRSAQKVDAIGVVFRPLAERG